MQLRHIYAFSLFCLSTLVTGCSDNKNNIPTEPILLGEILQSKYQASCANCHTNAATGAPVKGDIAAWSEILDKPMADTMARVINGYNGMPPLGQCFDCSEKDLQTMVLFLAQKD
jgi:cytochrome c5